MCVEKCRILKSCMARYFLKIEDPEIIPCDMFSYEKGSWKHTRHILEHVRTAQNLISHTRMSSNNDSGEFAVGFWHLFNEFAVRSLNPYLRPLWVWSVFDHPCELPNQQAASQKANSLQQPPSLQTCRIGACNLPLGPAARCHRSPQAATGCQTFYPWNPWFPL